MELVPLFVDSPLYVKIIFSVIVLLPTFLSSSSIVLHFKKDKKHSNCRLYPSLIQRDEMKEEIKEIKDRITLKEQMSALSSANNRLIFLLRKVYLTLNNDNLDIQHYDMLLRNAKEELKDTVRSWLRENHYTLKTEKQWVEYKEKRKGDMIDIVVYHLNKGHKDEYFKIKRALLSKVNTKEVIPTALDVWDSMYDEFREIARRNENRIKELEKKLEVWE